MLTHLLISNYALIDSLEIDFKKGLTIITVETGAGKSIILGALSLIFGERADAKVIRNSESKSIIEASFNIENNADIDIFLEQNDIDSLGNECILRREISSNGRSRVFINDSPVTLTVLRDLSLKLVDIHSQHSNMLLGNEYYQLRILDCLSNNEDLRKEYASIYDNYRKLKSKLLVLKENYEKSKQDEDYIRFQLSQIETLKLQENEDEELEKEQVKLSNIADIKSSLWQASSIIQENEDSVLSMLSVASRGLIQVENVDAELKEISERLQSSVIELKDIACTLSSLQDGYIDNPQELERINDRLNNIYDLQTKHKVANVNELLNLQHTYEKKLAIIDNSDEEIRNLEKELIECERQAINVAEMLSQSRKQGCESFKSKLEEYAVPLGLKNIRFDIGFDKSQLSENGIDKIKFLFAFNKQQQLMPIENTASGGELSRVMLCVKAIVAQNMQLPTIIFDEVDTGVSGEIAHKMGEMMYSISRNIQVLAISHLPQVAVKGDSHYKVFKDDCDDATFTSMCELSEKERVYEIARMLSGEKIDEAALNNAKSLLGF